MHIFHEGLSTLYEDEGSLNDDEDEGGSSPAIKTPDAVQMRARWELARSQLFEDGEGGVVTPRSGILSSYEI